MASKPKFLICTNNLELPGYTFILCTKQPYYLGRVVVFDTDLQYAEWTNQYRGLGFAQVFSYRMVVHFYNSLAGKLLVHANVETEIRLLLEEMAAFYKECEIDNNSDNFKKYLF